MRTTANVNAHDHDGKTALMYSAEKNSPDNVKLLLSYGADVSLKSLDGKSAADFSQSEEVKNLLTVK